MQKGFVPIFLLIGILVMASVLSGALYFDKLKLPQPAVNSPIVTTPTPQSVPVDETANWKTYVNDRYGFSFEYPSIWVVKTGDSDSRQYGKYAFFYKTGEKIDPSYMSKRGNEQMTLNMTYEEFDTLKRRSNLPEFTVANKRALRLSTGVYILIDEKSKDVNSKNVLRIFRYPDEENYMEAILASFKLLDQTKEINGWQASCQNIINDPNVKYKECEMEGSYDSAENKKMCEELGGQYQSCSSPCRHDPSATVCIQSCVQLCVFK